MKHFPELTAEGVLRAAVVVILPWLPAYAFERIDWYFGVVLYSPWYGYMTGWRLPVDVASFALGGLLLAYLVRPRWAVLQVGLSALLIWVLFYVACQTFTSDRLLHSECYQVGPDGLAGLRLSLMMFMFGALAPIARAAEKREALNAKARPFLGLFGGIIVTAVMVWFPLSAWFSGVTYLDPFPIFQGLVLLGVPLMVTGMLAARLSGSAKVATLSGLVSFLSMAGVFWTLLCPSCDRTFLAPLVPLWILFALLGGLIERGYPGKLPFGQWWRGRISLEDVRRVAAAIVIVVSLWTAVGWSIWSPSVLYADTISPGAVNPTLGLPRYPYVAGFYNSTQYRICCLEIGVSFTKANVGLLGPNNFLMAGMGVQSPNCCIDGWDFGWRADVFLMQDRSFVVSGTTWGTCDSNANCGGIFWQYARYHAQVILHPANLSTPIYLRMMWEPLSVSPLKLQVNWYYNTTGVPWQKFGTFIPDFREGTYFDIGSIGVGNGNIPQKYAFFYQFGVASKTPVSGWTVRLLYPSFEYQGSWRLMERATSIQGDVSFWKGAYRWGGLPYTGVTARAHALDPSVSTDTLELSYTGGSLKDNIPLW